MKYQERDRNFLSFYEYGATVGIDIGAQVNFYDDIYILCSDDADINYQTLGRFVRTNYNNIYWNIDLYFLNSGISEKDE